MAKREVRFVLNLSETSLLGLLLNLLMIFTTIANAMRAYYNSQNAVVKKLVMATLLGFCTFVIHGLFNSFLDQDKIAGLVFTSTGIIVAADLSVKNLISKNKME